MMSNKVFAKSEILMDKYVLPPSDIEQNYWQYVIWHAKHFGEEPSVVSCVLFNNERTHVLLVRQKNELWTLPGGRRDIAGYGRSVNSVLDESLESALFNEFQEEVEMPLQCSFSTLKWLDLVFPLRRYVKRTQRKYKRFNFTVLNSRLRSSNRDIYTPIFDTKYNTLSDMAKNRLSTVSKVHPFTPHAGNVAAKQQLVYMHVRVFSKLVKMEDYPNKVYQENRFETLERRWVPIAELDKCEKIKKRFKTTIYEALQHSIQIEKVKNGRFQSKTCLQDTDDNHSLDAQLALEN